MKKLLSLLALSCSALVFAHQPGNLLVVDPHRVLAEATKVPGNFLNGRNNVAISVDGQVVARTCRGQLPGQLDDCLRRLVTVLDRASKQDLMIAVDPQDRDFLPALTNLHVSDLK